jgi:hypothetical protein
MFTNELGRQLLALLLQRENQIQNKTYKYIIQTNMKKEREIKLASTAFCAQSTASGKTFLELP